MLDSTTMGVIAIRARRAGSRIHYRVVDEYGTAYAFCLRTSRQPLTFAELVRLIRHLGPAPARPIVRHGPAHS